MDKYEQTRAELLERVTEARVAPPVGRLLAAAWEPRVGGESATPMFQEAMTQERAMVKEVLSGLTIRRSWSKPQHGGAVEDVALEAAKRLLELARAEGLDASAALLEKAIRDRFGEDPESDEPPAAEIPEPLRRKMGEGRGHPIGLWR